MAAAPPFSLEILFDATPVIKDHYILADYAGEKSNGGLIGVIVWATDTDITELEGYSVDGTEPALGRNRLRCGACQMPDHSFTTSALRRSVHG